MCETQKYFVIDGPSPFPEVGFVTHEKCPSDEIIGQLQWEAEGSSALLSCRCPVLRLSSLTFNILSLKPLNWIWRDLTRYKNLTSSTKSVFFSGQSEKQNGRPAYDWLRPFWLLLWLVVLWICVALAIFQRYRDLEAGDNPSLKS